MVAGAVFVMRYAGVDAVHGATGSHKPCPPLSGSNVEFAGQWFDAVQ